LSKNRKKKILKKFFSKTRRKNFFIE